MSKKQEFMNRLARGLTPDRAAELSGITSTKVKSRYKKEFEALQTAQASEVVTVTQSRFVRDFLALPPDLQTFYCTHRSCWGDFEDDFKEGRELREMLEEWQLFYAQTPQVRADYLNRPAVHDYSKGDLGRWLKTRHKPRTATIIPPTQDYPLEPSQTRLEAKSTKRPLSDQNDPSQVLCSQQPISALAAIPTVVNVPIASPPPPDRNIVGDPHGRQDHPQNPQDYWTQYRAEEEEAQAAARWAERNR